MLSDIEASSSDWDSAIRIERSMTVMKSNRIALAAKVQETDATRLWIDGRREFSCWRLRGSKRETEHRWCSSHVSDQSESTSTILS